MPVDDSDGGDHSPPARLGRDFAGLSDPLSGQWRLIDFEGDLIAGFEFGEAGDLPLLGDWDCDGVDTPGLFRPETGVVLLSNEGRPSEVKDFIEFMLDTDRGDLPLVGDINGDHCDSVSYYRPGTPIVVLINESPPELKLAFAYPGAGQMLAGDFFGIDVDTLVRYDPTTGMLLFQGGDGGLSERPSLASPEGFAVAGDWNLDGDDTVGIYIPSESELILPGELITLRFGLPGWILAP